MIDGEGEMHARIRLQLTKKQQLRISVISIFGLAFPERLPYNPIDGIYDGIPNEAIQVPIIEDTRYYFKNEEPMPSFYENMVEIPILFDVKKGIINKNWFQSLEEINEIIPNYFNAYHLEKLMNTLLSTSWITKEHYQLIEQEIIFDKLTVHFFRPHLPPKKTVIKGMIHNYYERKVSFSDFDRGSTLMNWNRHQDITLDTFGNFRAEFTLDKPAFLRLNHYFNSFRIFIEPGDSLIINIDGNAFFRKVKFAGDNAISNEILLKLFHELREDTYWLGSRRKVHPQSQNTYLQKIKEQQTKELSFLKEHQEKLTPTFKQFLNRHILFWNVEQLLSKIRYFYNRRDARIDYDYLDYCQRSRALFFRMPDNQHNFLLGTYLEFHNYLLRGRYVRQVIPTAGFKRFDFGKLMFIAPENIYRVGELTLFYNKYEKTSSNFLHLYNALQEGVNLPSQKEILADYLDDNIADPPSKVFHSLGFNQKAPYWKFPFNEQDSIAITDFQGEYLLLHIGFERNLLAAKSDIQEIKNNTKTQFRTLSIVTSPDTTLQSQKDVLYITSQEMGKLRKEYMIEGNANTFYIINPEGKSVTSPFETNSFQKLTSEVAKLPKIPQEKNWQPTPIFWQNLGITAFLLLFLGGVYAQRKRTLAKREQQKRQLVELELKGIRAQMNPHFLFNALSSIQNLIRKKEDIAADRYLTQFAGLVRKILRNSEQEFITLEEEMAAIKQYCSLEALRTPFDYELNISEGVDAFNTYIPGMLIQPLVENAILHGLMPQQGKRNLWINIKSHPKGLACEIVDNGIGIQKAQGQKQRHKAHQKSFGMALIRQRLGLLLNQPESTFLTIQDRSELTPPATGTIVNLIIPIEQ